MLVARRRAEAEGGPCAETSLPVVVLLLAIPHHQPPLLFFSLGRQPLFILFNSVTGYHYESRPTCITANLHNRQPAQPNCTTNTDANFNHHHHHSPGIFDAFTAF